MAVASYPPTSQRSKKWSHQLRVKKTENWQKEKKMKWQFGVWEREETGHSKWLFSYAIEADWYSVFKIFSSIFIMKFSLQFFGEWIMCQVSIKIYNSNNNYHYWVLPLCQVLGKAFLPIRSFNSHSHKEVIYCLPLLFGWGNCSGG